MSEQEEKDITTDDDRSEQPAEEPKPEPKKRSRDRNQRVRELAARKLEEAKASSQSKPARPAGAGLDAGEMFDDVVARGFASFTRWVKANRRAIEMGAVVALLGGVGYATWDWYSAKRLGTASAALFAAVRDEDGVVKDDKGEQPASPDEEESRFDTRAKFPTYQARTDAALNAYRSAADSYRSLGAGMLARLGEASMMLDKHDYDGALNAANAVLSSELAKADVSVQMAARELSGMALEGKGDLDGAKKAFEEMAASSDSTYKDLGEYHTARMLLAKGDKDAAKEKLSKLRDKLTGVSATEPNPPSEYLAEQVDLMLRGIDPSLAPSKGASPGSQLTPEQLQRLQQEIQRLSGGNAPTPPMPEPGTPPAPPTPPTPPPGTP